MGDGRRFDEISRIWASPMSRRRALRLSAGVIFGGVVANVLSSQQAWAPPAPCTSNADCPSSVVCIGGICRECSSDAQCGAGNLCVGEGTLGSVCFCQGATSCNTVCCSPGSANAVCCGSTTDTCAGGACCPSGQGCGSTCCPRSTVCLNASTGTCGCPSGAPRCGNFCCKAGETCSDPRGGCCCPKGSTPCGASCCASGVACVDRANGICGCQAGTTPCGSGANLRCCPPGTACTSGCPLPSNNTVAGHCSAAASDRNMKADVVAISWEP